MKRTNDIAALAAHYDWPISFVGQILARIKNPKDLSRACQMYKQGTLSLDDINATGEKIDIPALRHTIASNLWNKKKLQSEQFREMMAKQKEIAEYYATCVRINCSVINPEKKSRGIQSAFINDGRLVAFGYWDEKDGGGIYMANNDVMPNFHWDNLHKNLGDIRRRNKPFYKRIKQACHHEPMATFRFDEKTIRK